MSDNENRNDALVEMRLAAISAMKKIEALENHNLLESEEKILIMEMIDNNNVEALREIRELGVDFSKEKSFVLVYAAHYNKTDCVEYFIGAVGLKVSADDFGALRSSTRMDADDVTKFLLEQELSKPTLSMALVELSFQGNTQMVKHITEKFDFDRVELDLAFDAACVNERKEVALHIHAISDISVKDDLDKRLAKWGEWAEGTDYATSFNKETVKAEMVEISQVKEGLKRMDSKASKLLDQIATSEKAVEPDKKSSSQKQ